MNKIILGLDCSSSCIGYGVLEIDDNNNINYINMNYIKPIKKGSIIDRLIDTRNKINILLKNIKPDYIAIEDIIQYMPGSSSANTIITLASFNRMVCLAAHDYLGHSPTLYSVMTIRHALKKDKVLPQKEELPDLVSELLMITFPWELNRNGKPKSENLDKCDGLCVALRLALEMTGKLKTKVKKAKKAKKAKKNVVDVQKRSV